MEEFITLEGDQIGIQRICCETAPSPSPTLVFLHDALGSIRQWRDFPNTLCQKCQLNGIILERLGHGKSSPRSQLREKSFFQEEAWEVLPVLLKNLHIEDAILIGHSDGATIGLLYASKFPLKALITIAAHVCVEEITRLGIREAQKNRTFLVERLKKYHGQKAEWLFDAWSRLWLSEEFDDFNLENELADITCPILIVQSLQDEYGSLEQVERIKNQVHSPWIELYLPARGGHSPHLFPETHVIDQISDFIGNLR